MILFLIINNNDNKMHLHLKSKLLDAKKLIKNM